MVQTGMHAKRSCCSVQHVQRGVPVYCAASCGLLSIAWWHVESEWNATGSSQSLSVCVCAGGGGAYWLVARKTLFCFSEMKLMEDWYLLLLMMHM